MRSSRSLRKFGVWRWRWTEGRPCPDSDVALELRLADGSRDVLVALDAENPRGPARSRARR